MFEKKKQKALKIINNLHTLLASFILCRQYYFAKCIIEFIIAIQEELNTGKEIYLNCIDNLKELKFDLAEFDDYVKEFDVNIYR